MCFSSGCRKKHTFLMTHKGVGAILPAEVGQQVQPPTQLHWFLFFLSLKSLKSVPIQPHFPYSSPRQPNLKCVIVDKYSLKWFFTHLFTWTRYSNFDGSAFLHCCAVASSEGSQRGRWGGGVKRWEECDHCALQVCVFVTKWKNGQEGRSDLVTGVV